MNVVLTPEEFRHAVQCGAEQRCLAILRPEPLKQTYDLKSPGWDQSISGALAECACAKALDLKWDGNVGRIGGQDVGVYQVRSTWRWDGCMILHENDAGRVPFILVSGSTLKWTLLGWAFPKRSADGSILEVHGGQVGSVVRAAVCAATDVGAAAFVNGHRLLTDGTLLWRGAMRVRRLQRGDTDLRCVVCDQKIAKGSTSYVPSREVEGVKFCDRIHWYCVPSSDL